MKKTDVKSAIADLPEKFDLDLLAQKLIVIDQIEKGLEDVRAGRVVSHQEVEAYFKDKWVK